MMNTIAQNLQRLITAKSDIATAITAKGGTVNEGDGFEDFSADIATIPSGGGSEGIKINTKSIVSPHSIESMPEDWIPMDFGIDTTSTFTFYGRYGIWTDGENIYYSYGLVQYVLDKSTSTWNKKTWNGYIPYQGRYIWTDGTDIYYSRNSDQYVLDKSTSTWNKKTWNDGYIPYQGIYIWTDGDNVYYSDTSSRQYVLDKSTSTWSTKTWGTLTGFYGNNVWTSTDGSIYYSSGSTQYVLNKSTSNWSSKSWTGLTSFNGSDIWTNGNDIYYTNGATYILTSTSKWSSTSIGVSTVYGQDFWTDGTKIYISAGSTQKVSGKSTISFTNKTWLAYTFNGSGNYIWTDGENIYYSDGSSNQYVLNKSTYTWEPKTWTGLTSFYGNYIWTDGINIFYSYGSTQKVLDKSTSTWYNKTWTGLTSFYGNNVWTSADGPIYYSSGSSTYKLNVLTGSWSSSYSNIDIYGYAVFRDFIYDYYMKLSSTTLTFYRKDTNSFTWNSVATYSASFGDNGGQDVWSDGMFTYFDAGGTTSYELNTRTFTGSSSSAGVPFIRQKGWVGGRPSSSMQGRHIWTDGQHIYYSNGSTQYKLNR